MFLITHYFKKCIISSIHLLIISLFCNIIFLSIILRKSDIMDLRILKTEEAIKKAFKEMLLEMPYEKITIKELCQRAVINRKTFYLHYNSIEDVLERFQEEQSCEYFDRIKDFDHVKEVDKLIKIFFQFSQEQGEFYEIIHCNNHYDYIHKKQSNKISLKSQDNFRSIKKFDENKQNIILSYISNSQILILDGHQNVYHLFL